MKTAKLKILEFFKFPVANQYLVSKVRDYFLVCEKLKRRFKQAIARRQYKLSILGEYWQTITDTCLYLNAAKTQAAKNVKKFNGHKFYIISDMLKKAVLKDFIRQRDL